MIVKYVILNQRYFNKPEKKTKPITQNKSFKLENLEKM